MAYNDSPIAVDSSLPARTPLAFRRADGSRREFLFDDCTHSLPLPAASLFWNPEHHAGNNGNSGSSSSNGSSGSGSNSRHSHGHGHGHGYGHSYSRRPIPAPLPRSVLRPFRRDNGEPAADIRFVRETRQSVCRDGVDRSRCCECRRRVTSTSKQEAKLEAPTTPPYRRYKMSPQRVFRDLIMSDAAEPLPPRLRDALLNAFNATVERQSPQHAQKRKAQPSTRPPAQLDRPLLPSPPPTSTATAGDKIVAGTSVALAEFHCFSRLPYEIRVLIWEQALPFRVLLREDLASTTYRSIRRVFRPASHVHTLEMLWQSDLFYVCVEARRVVEAAFGGDTFRYRASSTAATVGDDGPPSPLVRCITSPSRLRSGRDVLYYPWLGVEAIRNHASSGFGGGGPWTLARDHVQQQHHHHHQAAHGYPLAGASSNIRTWMSKYDSGRRTSSSPPASDADTIATLTSVPYGCWASQLRHMRLPAKTVALDATWIDRGHPDTIAWAAGVDLSQDEEDDQDEGDGREDKPARETVAAPTSLQVVVADLHVPVRIRLGSSDRTSGTTGPTPTNTNGITPAQQHLLRQHIAPQPWQDARSFQRALDHGPRSQPSLSASTSAAATMATPLSTNLNGMDFSVLVDLYDDWRIEELLSLQGASDPDPDVDDGHDTHDSVLNKAALHRCVACTRRAWEARSAGDRDCPDGGSSWTTKFGSVLGAHLQKLCRPTIVFSIVLSFVDEEEV
ncbi:hypothetical protein SPBR_01419 [Sporothrix brasiliensis 5110]|uniref:2EXR domain-containing protein n=1 Tax=Sporothrix brasiliensis 5110 TaxID=1398154 RepID=A0A0C2IWX6_9PEZI|nr:uncharacterized protein SPBR_01419 [Sporothrix brasiliensis 5110]KIH91255.1 hypothetical protein SPBR_01419 [Sporothrix brasiliensis 5110]